MFISGTSGHACEDSQHKHPYVVDGRLLKLNFAKPIYELHLQQGTGGTIAGSPVSGVAGTQFGLSATSNNKYTFDGFSVTGTTLTGSAGKFNNSDVTAKGNWTYHPAFVPTGRYRWDCQFQIADPPRVNTSPTIPLTGTMGFGVAEDTIALSANAGETINILPCFIGSPKILTGTLGLKKTPNIAHASAQRGLLISVLSADIPFSYSSYYKGELVNSAIVTYNATSASQTYRYLDKRVMDLSLYSADYLEIDPNAYFTVKANKPWTIYNIFQYVEPGGQNPTWYPYAEVYSGRVE